MDADRRALDPHDHACLIYDAPRRRVEATVREAADAAARHERFLCLSNDEMRRETMEGMRAVGIGPEWLEAGQVAFVTERAPFCEDGLFTAPAMTSFINAEIARAISDGFSGLRVCVEMTWILGNELETMRVLECESRLNETLSGASAVVLCQWDRTAFEPMIMLEVLRTHPLVIIGDEVLDNAAYYVPPAEYLASRSASEQLDRQLDVLRGLESTRRAAQAVEESPSAPAIA